MSGECNAMMCACHVEHFEVREYFELLFVNSCILFSTRGACLQALDVVMKELCKSLDEDMADLDFSEQGFGDV